MEWVLGVGAGLVVAATTAVAIRERRSADRARRVSELLGRSGDELQQRVTALDQDTTTMQNVLSSMEEGVVLVGPTGGVRL